MNIKLIISEHIKKTLKNKNIIVSNDLMIIRTSDKKKWDYQVNGIIKISKSLNQDPYTISTSIVTQINCYNYSIYKKLEVSKPGFINIYINNKWMEIDIQKRIYSSRLGIKKVKPQKIIIDYSSPNIAKEMHIGHLRSTILGDSIAKIMEFLGHNVIRTNHIGDCGTNLGMIIAYLKKNFLLYQDINKINLETIYQKSKKLFDTDQKFSQNARNQALKLQNKEKSCLKIWKKIVTHTIIKNDKIYKKLNITLTNKHIIGESFYNDMLPQITQELKDKKIAIEHNGAIIVFLNKFKNRNGNPMGILIQKQDGAYLYATIDLACLKYRCNTLKADQILYYVDSRQQQYFKQIFEIAKKSGYIPKNTIIKHHAFGMICSKNKNPFKTRSGENIKLSKLLNESITRARKITKSKNKNLSDQQLDYLSEKIGISAIKYFDLSKHRLTDYIFKWDKMLSFNGNTAPYMQYAYIRILSIFKKLNTPMFKLTGKIILTNVYEKKLTMKLLQFEEIILESSENSTPHLICKYLYELSTIFSIFYEKCSILFSKDRKIQKSRLLLSFITARTLKKGLHMIGVSTVSYM
ncbi:MAG: arginine--tRNA ligase [Buchnera aphidicola (Chaetogeoica yunlongensis)]